LNKEADKTCLHSPIDMSLQVLSSFISPNNMGILILDFQVWLLEVEMSERPL